jgi:hypothetical protein
MTPASRRYPLNAKYYIRCEKGPKRREQLPPTERTFQLICRHNVKPQKIKYSKEFCMTGTLYNKL